MPQTPDHSSNRGPHRPERVAVRARAEELRAVFEAVDAACDRVERAGARVSRALWQRWLEAEQQLCDYTIDHYEDLKGLDWVESIYATQVIALKDAQDAADAQAAAKAQVAQARESFVAAERMELAALVARPEDVTWVGNTGVFHYGVEEIIQRAIEGFVDEVLTEGPGGPDGLEEPGL